MAISMPYMQSCYFKLEKLYKITKGTFRTCTAWQNCTRLKMCVAWPTIGTAAKKRMQSKATFISFWSKNSIPSVFSFNQLEWKLKLLLIVADTFLTFPNCIATRNTSKIIWEHLINSDLFDTSALVNRFKRLQISLSFLVKKCVFLTFYAETSVSLQTYIPLSMKSSLLTQPNHSATN